MGFNITQFGGGAFVPYSEITRTSTPSGVTGDIYDITPSPSNTLRVIRLSTGNTNLETGMTVTITNDSGQTTILNNADLADNTPNTGDFYIGRYSIGSLSQVGGLEFVDCQRIVVTKVSGNTVNPIDIAYIEGRFE